MATATYLDFPYDQEIFNYKWGQLKDTTSLALLNSGAMISSEEIREMISNGGNVYTLPFYNLLGGTEDNYDGNTDITDEELSGSYQSGIVYGRAKSFSARDFVKDFNSGADPEQAIINQVANWYNIRKQARLVKILNAVFGLPQMASHIKNIALTTTGTVGEANKVGATTIGDATVDALGDTANDIVLAIMHSKVANNLAGLNLLQFRKYTDAQGIERQLSIADANGKTVIVTDQGTSATNETTGEVEYTTYLLGRGALLEAPAPVDVPSEKTRDAKKDGGMNYLVTRKRETIHPNGFNWSPSTVIISPTDDQLGNTANWSLAVEDLKLIPMVKVVSNG